MAEPRRDAKGTSLDYEADRTKAEHESMLAKEKYDPAMRGGSKTQAEVKASGGLGALAAKQAELRKKKQQLLKGGQ